MKLSAEVYDRILDALRADPPQVLSREKREEPRAGVRGFVNIIPPTGGVPLRVPVRDLSRKGIGILCAHEMWPGEQFVLMLPGDGGGMGVVFSVAYCRQISPDLHGIGGRMVRPGLKA